jgi:pimeloyl-ACP methyl ester carboxylesterase
MHLTDPSTLEVPGASLRYEVCGSGPVLLLIPGGVADAAMFAGVVPLLSDGYTVVTYDPRGISRSTLEDPTRDVPVEVQADDARRLISAVTSEPAYVFANSSGAITGLALMTQHPGQVRTLVAHEPPVTELLADRENFRLASAEVYNTYLKAGAGVAMGRFMVMAGLAEPAGPGSASRAKRGARANGGERGAHANGGGRPAGPAADGPRPIPDPQMLAVMARMQGNLDLFFAHMFGPITSYVPDQEALREVSSRVVVAVGTTSTGQTAHRAAVALGAALGTPPVGFPGGHGDFTLQPEEFARTLSRVLSGQP